MERTEYYGPTKNAKAVINNILCLRATGREQDWEIELASPNLVEKIISELLSTDHEKEVKSALFLLLIFSVQEADVCGELDQAHVDEAKSIRDGDLLLGSKAAFYFSQIYRAEIPSLVKKIVFQE